MLLTRSCIALSRVCLFLLQMFSEQIDLKTLDRQTNRQQTHSPHIKKEIQNNGSAFLTLSSTSTTSLLLQLHTLHIANECETNVYVVYEYLFFFRDNM